MTFRDGADRAIEHVPSEEAGRSEPVGVENLRLYLRHIGSVRLLTPPDEVESAPSAATNRA